MNFMLMSAIASVMIVIALLIRWLMFNRLMKTTFSFVWLLILFRLLLPLEIPIGISFNVDGIASHLSLYDLTFTTESEGQRLEISSPLELESSILPLNDPLTPSAPHVDESLSLSQMLHLVWAIGVVSFALYFMRGHFKFLREVRDAIPVTNETTRQFLDPYQSKLWRRIQLKESQKIATPLTYGILRPVILVPKHLDWKENAQIIHTLTHEYVHIKRFDCLVKLVAAIALCLHWFNPLVWLMYLFIHRDLELACDELTIRHLGEENKSTYALTLIDLATTQKRQAVITSHFSQHVGIKTRIHAMKTMKKRSLLGLLGSSLVMILISSGMFVYATSQPINSSYLSETDAPLDSEKQLLTVENIGHPIEFGGRHFTAYDYTWQSELVDPNGNHQRNETHLSMELAATIAARHSMEATSAEINGATLKMTFWTNEAENNAFWGAVIVDSEDHTQIFTYLVIDATTGELIELFVNAEDTPFLG